MTETFAKQCLDILKRDDVRKECNKIFSPVIDFVFQQINPYIYFFFSLIVILFIMLFIILFLLLWLLRSHHLLLKQTL
jgi:hypothetical protein